VYSGADQEDLEREEGQQLAGYKLIPGYLFTCSDTVESIPGHYILFSIFSQIFSLLA